MWGLMAKKGRFIEQFFRGDPNLREMEDLGEADTYEQLAAMTTEDPRVLHLAQLSQDLKKLERRQSAHRSEQFRHQYAVQQAEAAAAEEAEGAAKMQETIARSHQITGENFRVTVGDQVLTKREDAVKAIDAAVAAAFPDLEVGQSRQIGEIGGLKLSIWAGNHQEYEQAGGRATKVLVKDDAPYFMLQLYPGKDLNLGKVAAPNMIASAASYLRMLPDYLAGHLERQRAAEARVQSSRAMIGQPFPDAAQIPPLRRQVAELEAALGTPPTVAPEEAPGEAIPAAPAAAPESPIAEHTRLRAQQMAMFDAKQSMSEPHVFNPDYLKVVDRIDEIEKQLKIGRYEDAAFTGSPELAAAQQRLGAIADQLDPEEKAAIDSARARAGEAADEAGICIGESED